MRALGAGKSVVDLPEWVEVHVACDRVVVSAGVAISAECHRCAKVEHFPGPRRDDEKALGAFARRHRACPDPALIEAAVQQAPIDRARAAERDAWFARQRAAGHVWQPRRRG